MYFPGHLGGAKGQPPSLKSEANAEAKMGTAKMPNSRIQNGSAQTDG